MADIRLDLRHNAALALIDTDPVGALDLASELCTAEGLASCGINANYVIARLAPDPQRRAASQEQLLSHWRSADAAEHVDEPHVALLLARAGAIGRDELAQARAGVQASCHDRWTAVDACLAADPGPPP